MIGGMGGPDMGASYPDPVAGQRLPLYVHVPFCESLCPFCPFHRVLLDEPLADDYMGLLQGQLEILARRRYVFNELCVGGGTPTSRPLALLGFIRKARSLWDFDQITVETNPNHLRPDLLQSLRDAGVTRLSVGVQSLHNDRLRQLGRLAPYGGRAAILEGLARAQGMFDTFNVDMIFNLPGQTMEELDEDIALLKAAGVDQISFHPLMPTDDDLHGAGEFDRVDFKREEAMYRWIIDALAPEYRRGTVWCFNRKAAGGDEYFARNPDYLGIGSGAFSLLHGCFHATDFNIARYMEACRAGGSGLSRGHPLGPVAVRACRLLTRLFALRVAAHEMKDLALVVLALRLLGWVRHRDGVVELTDCGCYRWLVFMRRFFMNVNRYRQALRRGEDAPFPFTVCRVLLRLWA